MENELTVIFNQQPIVGTSVKYIRDGQVRDSAPIMSVALDPNSSGIYIVTTSEGIRLSGPVQYSTQSNQTYYGQQYQNSLSGIMPPNTPVPEEIAKGLNWGAFLLGPFWAIGHRVWIGLLCFVPYVHIAMAFILLLKGNEWGWQSREFKSIDEFKQVQKAWLIWGIIAFAVGLVSYAVFLFFYFLMISMAFKH